MCIRDRNMTVQSYNGNLDFGFIACRELVPDLRLMADLLNESMAELLAYCDPVEVVASTNGVAKPKQPRQPAPKKAAAKAAARPTTRR